MQFVVFHDGGYGDPSFEVSLVEASNALTAVRRVHKKDHNGTGDYVYFVLPAKDLQVIQSKMPTEASLTPMSVEAAKIPTIKEKGAKKK